MLKEDEMLSLKWKPWFSMWIAPRKTLRSMIQTQAPTQFLPLSLIYGWQITLQMAQSFGLSEVFSFWPIFIASFLAAPFVGAFGFYVGTLLLHWTGKWFGGLSSFLSLRSAISWANVTGVVSVSIGLFIALAFQKTAFCSNFVQMPISAGFAQILGGLFLLQIIVSIWTVCLLVAAVAEVQGFSIVKALMNIIAAIAVAVVGMWIISFIIKAITEI
jgi:hypothetical protein